MTDVATINLMSGLRAVLAIGVLVVLLYGATKVGKYTSRHAGDPISRRSAELSLVLWSGGLAIPLVALAYIAWAVYNGFVAFTDAETAANITAMAILGLAGFYFSRGRTPIELLRRRREWR
jgi:heme/copper-type cytochrome/quinol oxidase subunit 2